MLNDVLSIDHLVVRCRFMLWTFMPMLNYKMRALYKLQLFNFYKNCILIKVYDYVFFEYESISDTSFDFYKDDKSMLKL